MIMHILIALIACTALQIPIRGQVSDQREFIFYEQVLNELNSTENITGFYNKYNFTFILLLDSSKIDLIVNTGYPHIEEFRNYVPGLALGTQTVGFVTDKTEIKEVFQDKNSLKRILDCTNEHNSPNMAMTKFNYQFTSKTTEPFLKFMVLHGVTHIVQRFKMEFCKLIGLEEKWSKVAAQNNVKS